MSAVARGVRRRATLLAAVLIGVFAVGAGLGWGGPSSSMWVGDIAAPLASAAAGITALVASRRHRGQRRLAWTFIAAALLTWFVGECVWSVYELGLHVDAPTPSVADIAYLGAYPLAMTGLLLLAADGLRMSWLRTLLDAVLLTGAVTLVSAPTVIEPLIRSVHDGRLALAVTLAYPIADIALVSVVLLAVTRGIRNTGSATAFVLVVVSLLLQSVSDSVFAVASLHGDYLSGGLMDTGWFASYLLLGLAPMYDGGSDRRTAPIPRGWEVLLPYLAVGATGLGTVLNWDFGGRLDRFSLVVLAVVLGTLLARQAVVVSQNAQLVQRLQRLAFTDELTGLANRALLLDRLEHTLARRGEARVCLLLLDLDGFKTVNDSLGHSEGDALLCEAAQRLKVTTRGGDTVCRLGGDEFAVLLEGDANGEEGVRLARRLLGALSDSYDLGTASLRVTASIGIGEATLGESAGLVLQRAELAMYAAKAAGRARFAVYDPDMQDSVVARLALERDLQSALDEDEFSIAYQPVIELRNGRIIGVEALVRWHSPSRGPVSPLEFIPVAEECGLIGPLGERVLRRACAQVARWRQEGHDLVLAVNVSPRQLRNPAFPALVRAAIGDSGLPGDRLVLELTEGVLVENDAATSDALAELRDLGVRIAIDDFGTGWSSLSYLRRLPVDIVKLDRSFVRDLGVDDGVESVTRAIVTLSRDLRLTVVAEGVEDVVQLDTLTGMGCDLAQGFLLARPAEPEAVEALLIQPPGLPVREGGLALPGPRRLSR